MYFRVPNTLHVSEPTQEPGVWKHNEHLGAVSVVCFFEWKTQYFGARLFVGSENLYMQPTHNLTIPFGSTKLFVYCSL
jgi:hypothetical protein